MDFKPSYIFKKIFYFQVFVQCKIWQSMHNNECILMGFVLIVHLFSSIVDKIIFVYSLCYLHPVSLW
jgi:hypothetical protein